MPHSPRRAPRPIGVIARWAATSLLLSLSATTTFAQASGGGVVHGGGKGGIGQVTAPAGGRAGTTGIQKAMTDEPAPPAIPLLPQLCTLSAPLLGTAQCTGTIGCGPGIEVPCRSLSQGIAMTAAGTGLRNTDRGIISIFGTKDVGEVVLALAVWAELAVGAPPPGSREIMLDGVPLTGKLLLEAPDPCWFGDLANGSLRAYIADATSIVTEELNREYEIVIPYAQMIDRSDPWPGPLDAEPPPVAAPDRLLLEGASLIIFYSTGAAPFDATSYLHSANEMLCHTQIFELALEPRLPRVVEELQHLMVVADSQARRQDGAVLPYRLWLTDDGSLEPLELEYAILRGPLSLIDKHTLHGSDGGEVAQLWDTAVSRTAPGTAGIVEGLPLYRMVFEPLLETPVAYIEPPPPAEPLPLIPIYRYDCAVPLIIGLTTR